MMSCHMTPLHQPRHTTLSCRDQPSSFYNYRMAGNIDKKNMWRFGANFGSFYFADVFWWVIIKFIAYEYNYYYYYTIE